MDTLEELEDIFSLAEDNEKFFLKECINNIRKLHERNERAEAVVVDMDNLQEEYEWRIEQGIPRSEWPDNVLQYEGYEVVGTVNSSGGCFPGFNTGPTPLADPEDWGIADVYPVLEPEVD